MTPKELKELIAATGIVHRCFSMSEEGRNSAGAYLHSVCSDKDPRGFSDDNTHQCLAEVFGADEKQAAARAHLIAYALNEILRKETSE
jgi:hypothetical protein